MRDEADDDVVVVVVVADELDIVDMAEAVRTYIQRMGEILREIAAEVIHLHDVIESGAMVSNASAS